MTYSSKNKQADEPHTIFLSYSGDGKGAIETYYYGEAKAPIALVKDFSQLRLTKEVQTNYSSTWKSRAKNIMKCLKMMGN